MTDPVYFGVTPSWAIAFATAVYAMATGGLAWVTHKAALRAAEGGEAATAKQIEAASTNVIRQIESGASSVREQIEATKEAALIQARATSVSNNRQGWINDLRNEVTAFLTDADIKDIIDNEMRLSEHREEEQLRIARALRSHIFKVRLLLNPTEGESTTLISMMEAVLGSGALTDEARDAIVRHTQGILKTEWERVKSGE